MTDLKVVELKLDPWTEKCRRESIDMIKDVLNNLEEGRIMEVVAVGIRADGGVFTYSTPTANAQLRLGAVALLQHQLLMDGDKERVDVGLGN